jgi:hypothetical protein
VKLTVEKFQPDRSVRKAPVPKAPGNAAPPSGKDFIKLNALENINSGNDQVDQRVSFGVKMMLIC